METAARWGLAQDQIVTLHRDYLSRLAQAALEDGVVTDAEQRDLERVARLLGQTPTLRQIMAEAAARPTLRPRPGTSPVPGPDLTGKRVCFTGQLQCCLDGEPISREQAAALAADAGLEVAQSVTKKLDILVVADPHSQSGKAKKARQYGVRIIHEAVFWKSLGVEAS